MLEVELSVFHQRDQELPAPAEERLGRKQRPWRPVERQPGLNEGARVQTLGGCARSISQSMVRVRGYRLCEIREMRASKGA